MGFITRGRGVTVHRSDCPNFESDEKNLSRLIEVSWDVDGDDAYLLNLEIVCLDKSGVLADLLALPSEMNLNIHSVNAMPNRGNKTSTVKICIEVKNSEQAKILMNRMRRIKNVFSVTRPMMKVVK